MDVEAEQLRKRTLGRTRDWRWPGKQELMKEVIEKGQKEEEGGVARDSSQEPVRIENSGRRE